MVSLRLTATKNDFCSNTSGIFLPNVGKISGNAQCQQKDSGNSHFTRTGHDWSNIDRDKKMLSDCRSKRVFSVMMTSAQASTGTTFNLQISGQFMTHISFNPVRGSVLVSP